ncbi:MAG: alpha/beta hydrolase [Pseudomonadota bacterium]
MTGDPSVTTGYISAQDGTPLFYRMYGDRLASAPPVLCLPGLTRNSHDFHYVASRLSSDFLVTCPDYRGRGRSGYCRSASDYAPPQLVADLADLMTALSIHGAALIGTSLGGLLALGLAVMHPTSVAGLVLNDVGPDLDAEAVAPIGKALAQASSPANWDEAVRYLQDLLPDLGVPEPKSQGWLDVAKGTWRETGAGPLRFDFDERIIGQLTPREDIPDLWPLFRAVGHLPVGVIRGAKSPVLTSDGLARMRAAHPDLIHATIDNVGHAPHLDEPASREVIDAVLSHIR